MNKPSHKQDSLFESEGGIFSAIENCLVLRRGSKSATRRRDERFALDEMFEKSQQYRRSVDYFRLLEFMSKFSEHAPFNVALLHTQNPDAQYVMTAGEWERKFGCRIKRDARPCVIMWPFGPVHFVFDVQDVEPLSDDHVVPIPEEIRQPFKTEGTLEPGVLELTIENCRLHAIEVRDDLKGAYGAGKAIRLTDEARAKYKDLKLLGAAKFLILLNTRHSREEKYGTLAHEIAHILCGHLGSVPWAWWEDNRDATHEVREIEAESVAYLVCRRHGLTPVSEKYVAWCSKLSGKEMPTIALHAVVHAVDDIEKLGKELLKKPLHKPLKR